MARSDFKLHREVLQQYLDGEHGVEADLEQRAQAVAAEARATAPFLSGAYRDSIKVETDRTDRMVKRIASDVAYAMVVEANEGTLDGALDAGR